MIRKDARERKEREREWQPLIPLKRLLVLGTPFFAVKGFETRIWVGSVRWRERGGVYDSRKRSSDNSTNEIRNRRNERFVRPRRGRVEDQEGWRHRKWWREGGVEAGEERDSLFSFLVVSDKEGGWGEIRWPKIALPKKRQGLTFSWWVLSLFVTNFYFQDVSEVFTSSFPLSSRSSPFRLSLVKPTVFLRLPISIIYPDDSRWLWWSGLFGGESYSGM